MKVYKLQMTKIEKEVKIDLIRNPHLIYWVEKKIINNEIVWTFTFRHCGEPLHFETDETGAQIILHSLRQFYKTRPNPDERIEDWEWIDFKKSEFDYERRERILLSRMSADEINNYVGELDGELKREA